MKLSTAIKKTEKISGNKIKKEGLKYSVEYKGFSLSFYVNGKLDEKGEGEITNIYTRMITDKDDLQIDYFPGTFHDNITQAFKFIDYLKRSINHLVKE